MQPAMIASLLMLAAFIAAILQVRRKRRRGRLGSAAAGAVYDLLNEDRRKAVEIIVERAGARDPETADDKPSPAAK